MTIGLIGPHPQAKNYQTEPWASGCFYTSKLSTAKTATIESLGVVLKQQHKIIEELDIRTNDILSKLSKDDKIVEKDPLGLNPRVDNTNATKSLATLLSPTTKRLYAENTNDKKDA